MRRIGVPIAGRENDAEAKRMLRALLQGLQELGWKPGTNWKSDSLWRRDSLSASRLPQRNWLRRNPSVLLVETTPGTAAVLKETHTIPVIFTTVSDPVGAGFVRSLSHPGGNVTGFINIESSVGGRWLQLLKECDAAGDARAELFGAAAAPQADSIDRQSRQPQRLWQSRPGWLWSGIWRGREKEILDTAEDPSAGLIVGPDIFTFNHRFQIAELANSVKLPTIYSFTPFVTAGGLLSYGVDLPDLNRRAAIYVDRILKGAKPADLPVQLPTKFELAVNLKTAKAPRPRRTADQLTCSTADEVIE